MRDPSRCEYASRFDIQPKLIIHHEQKHGVGGPDTLKSGSCIRTKWETDVNVEDFLEAEKGMRGTRERDDLWEASPGGNLRLPENVREGVYRRRSLMDGTGKKKAIALIWIKSHATVQEIAGAQPSPLPKPESLPTMSPSLAGSPCPRA